MTEGYADLADLPEDQRIQVIGEFILRTGKTTVVCTDDLPGKPERYVRKILNKFPTLSIGKTFKGPTPGCVAIQVGPPGHIWGQ